VTLRTKLEELFTPRQIRAFLGADEASPAEDRTGGQQGHRSNGLLPEEFREQGLSSFVGRRIDLDFANGSRGPEKPAGASPRRAIILFTVFARAASSAHRSATVKK
jgi:hypothetical protein